ncbi:hypothetical protein MRB53_036846 [Persea americana]|nr:hypothetical protein MRB53_036846 [Persea americana]
MMRHALFFRPLNLADTIARCAANAMTLSAMIYSPGRIPPATRVSLSCLSAVLAIEASGGENGHGIWCYDGGLGSTSESAVYDTFLPLRLRET